MESLFCFCRKKSTRAPTITLEIGNISDQKIFLSQFYDITNISVIFIYLLKATYSDGLIHHLFTCILLKLLFSYIWKYFKLNFEAIPKI